MSKQVTALEKDIFVGLSVMSAALLVVVAVSCSDERSECSAYCSKYKQCAVEECMEYNYYYWYDEYYDYGACSWSANRMRECIRDCKEQKLDEATADYAECALECRHKEDCDDFEHCRSDCYWYYLPD